MGKKGARDRGGGASRRELPQAAPADEADLEPDDEDIAFVASHRKYAAFVGERLKVDAVSARASKKRKKAIAEEDKTAEFERGGARVAGAWERGGGGGGGGADGDAPPGDADPRAAPAPGLALPVKRLDGVVVHNPLRPAPIDGDDVDLETLPPAARAAVEKARAAWDRDADDGDDVGRAKGKKARRAQDLANAVGTSGVKQTASDKWWEKKDEDAKEASGGGRGAGEDEDEDDDEASDDSSSDDDGDSESASKEEEKEKEKEKGSKDSSASARRAALLSSLEAEMSREERLVSVRERIGAACQGALEDPEGRWTELKDVLALAEDRDEEVARLASLSMTLAFKDICPGYRIRPPTAKELAMKVSKETQKLRDFEAGLLKMYGGFVRLAIRRGGGEGRKRRADRGKGGPAPGVALRCLCELLEALPHFNYRTDVLSALVPHLARRDSAGAATAAEAMCGAIRRDLAGDVTLEALHMLAELVKTSRCACHPAALGPFLAVKFDEGALAVEARKKPEVFSRKQTRKKRQEEREMIRKGRAEKLRKQQEKERLRSFGHVDDSSDEDDDETLGGVSRLDRDLEEARGRVDEKARRKLHSRCLEATFETYFRVLKNAASEAPARGTPLLEGALVGLGAHTHLVSVDFTGDLMEVFRKLLAKEDAPLAADQKARCLLAACDILSGHGEALQVDLGEFHRQMYRMLLQERPLERREDEKADLDERKSAAGASVSSSGGYLRVRALQRFLGGSRQVDQPRAASFAKRLATMALGAEAGEAIGALGLARMLLARYPKTRCVLENERVGTGAFDQGASDPETAGGLSATLWELTSLAAHYHPAVRAAAREVGAMPLVGSVAPALGSHQPAELARLHSTEAGNFRPAIEPPKAAKRSTKGSPLDRRVGGGGRAEDVLSLGEALAAAVARSERERERANGGGDAGSAAGSGSKNRRDRRDRGGGGSVVERALRRFFLETKLFALNARLRREAEKLRRVGGKARRRREETERRKREERKNDAEKKPKGVEKRRKEKRAEKKRRGGVA